MDRRGISVDRSKTACFRGAAMTSRFEDQARLFIDPDQIGQFFGAIFAHADPGTYVALRAFEERTDAGPVINESVLVCDDRLIEEAVRLAQRAADHVRPTVFCPPSATFMSPSTARGADLANGLVLSVECDSAPEQARHRLEAILGPATLVVASGGVWSNPETGEQSDKLHLYWRLSEPTREATDHAKLRDLRRSATLIADADPSNVPLVHPTRWAGTWHCKGHPRMARIIAETGNEIDLDDAYEKLIEFVE